MSNKSNQMTGNLGPRIKELRSEKRLSLRVLAERAEVTASYISAVERGKISPTIALLSRLLKALDTDLAAFFTENVDSGSDFVFRDSSMRTVDDGGRRYTFVFPKRNDIRMEMLIEVFQPGEMPEFEKLSVDLAGYVLEGELLLEIEGCEPQVLSAGNGFYVPAGRPVRGRCAKDATVRMVTVVTPPRY